MGLQNRLGLLQPGLQADIVLLKREQGTFPLTDTEGQIRVAHGNHWFPFRSANQVFGLPVKTATDRDNSINDRDLHVQPVKSKVSICRGHVVRQLHGATPPHETSLTGRRRDPRVSDAGIAQCQQATAL